MKFATVVYNGNNEIGIDDSQGNLALIPLAFFNGPDRATMLDVIHMGAEGLKALKQQNLKGYHLIPHAEVKWLPPIPNPVKICGVAMNNSASNSRKISAPEHPAFFLKPASCLVGHRENISVREYYGSVHPEPELAVIIGRTIRDLAPEEIQENIFGYSIFNDVTGNGMRSEDLFRYYALYPKADNPDEVEKVEQHLSYAARYKGTDNFGSLGPWIVTRDEVLDPNDLNVKCWMKDEQIADDNTRFYNYKVEEVLSFLSYFHTLNAGDIVTMGTAFKPGATRKSIHHANFQNVEGPVSIEIEGLGRQENPIIVEQTPLGRWRFAEAQITDEQNSH